MAQTVSGSLTITPTQIAFNGSKCLLSWASSGAEQVSITGLGRRPVNGSEYVYVSSAMTYVATFTNYTDTVSASVSLTTVADPELNVITGSIGTRSAILTVDIARNLNAGQLSVNARRLLGDGTPAYIISSRLE